MSQGHDPTSNSQFLERPKKVVIVDDSRSLRGWLRTILQEDPRLEVVGEAEDAYEAREVIKRTNPDVITLDVEMPGMSGLAFLEKLMALHPMPVVMFSGLTRRNSEATISALSLGAVDCLLKPSAAIGPARCRDIVRRVHAAAQSKVQATQSAPQQRYSNFLPLPNKGIPIILIGASTGGVVALEQVLANLNPHGPPVVIVQHMPGTFLESFADLLNSRLKQHVSVAKSNEPVLPGHVWLAPAAGYHTTVALRAGQWWCRFHEKPQANQHCPSVDVLFESAVCFAEKVVAVILTGLGRDGAEAMLRLREAGAMTLAQDKNSSVVYGMPRAAAELGAVQQIWPMAKMGEAIDAASRTLLEPGRGTV